MRTMVLPVRETLSMFPDCAVGTLIKQAGLTACLTGYVAWVDKTCDG